MLYVSAMIVSMVLPRSKQSNALMEHTKTEKTTRSVRKGLPKTFLREFFNIMFISSHLLNTNAICGLRVRYTYRHPQ